MNFSGIQPILKIIILFIFISGPLSIEAYVFNNQLDLGNSGTDVSALQETLRDLSYFTYPTITGYFGTVTQTAVQAFQTARGIVSSGTPESTGYGRVGPATLLELNTSQNTQVGSYGTVALLKALLERIKELQGTSSVSQADTAVATNPDLDSPSLTATGRNGEVLLKWDAVSEATSYLIKRKEQDGQYETIDTVNSTTYTDTDLSRGTRYYYTVTAVNDDGQGPASEYAYVYLSNPGGGGGGSSSDSNAPAIPTSLSVTEGDAEVTIEWNDPSDTDLAFISIYRGTTSGSLSLIATTTAGVEEYIDVPLTNDTNYYYALTATDESGNESTWTSEIEASPTGAFDIYIDSANGDDLNDGTSSYVALQSISGALLNSSSGDTIGLRAGQNHLSTTTISTGRIYDKYGTGSNPVMDARQSLSDKVWTLHSGNTWKTTISLASNSVAGGTGSNTTNFGVWYNDQFGTWEVGGADIATNLAAVDSDSGLAFAVNRQGSATQDIRSDTASTGPFELYVRLPDGSDPNGKSIMSSHKSSAGSFNGGEVANVTFIGGFGKDSVGIEANSYDEELMTLRNVSTIDFGEHGWVGPVNIEGTYTASGAPRPGTTGYAKGRAGSGLNLYTNIYLSTRDLALDTLDISNSSNALYGHGSGNQGYRNVTVDSLTIDNTTNGVQFDVATGFNPFIVGTLTINEINATAIDTAFKVDGDWVVNSGSISFDPSPLNPAQQALANFTGTAPSLTLKDMSVDFTLAIGAGKARILAIRATDATHTAPVLILDNFHDISATGKKGYLARGGTANIQSKIDLTLVNGTTIGDIMDQANGTNYPSSLTVEAGSTFGMGDRTGPQIESALTDAGIPHSISHDTTIVNRAGTVLSSPGW